jgi:hypothetical protein
MAYTPEAYKDKPKPKAGTQINAVVKSIEDGKIKDFVGKEALTSWKNVNPDTQVIQVTAITETGFDRKKTIVTPMNDQVDERSNLGKWKAKYGAYPYVGQEIYLIADGDGYFQFAL